MDPTQPLMQVAQAGLLGALLAGAIMLWYFERKLVNTCSDKLVEAWKSLGEIVSAHNQVAREQIASQDARSRALEAQTRVAELQVVNEANRAEVAKAIAQEVRELRGSVPSELQDLRGKIERLEMRIEGFLRERQV